MKRETLNFGNLRRPFLALIAGSALLLGGAAMPSFYLNNPNLLYVAGEFRMAMGDHEGGLRLISNAAQQSDKAKAAQAQTTAPIQAPAAKMAKSESKPKCKPAAVKMVASEKMEQPTPAHYMQLAKLQQVDFSSPRFDKAAYVQEIRRSVEAQRISNQEELRHTLARVQADLERQGIRVPVSPNPSVAGAPQAPLPPVVTP